MDCNDIYRERRHHKECFRKVSEIDGSPEVLNFWRAKASYKGISDISSVVDLTATSVDDGFFEEICEMKQLDRLVIDTLKVSDISKILNLRNLRYLQLVKVKPTKSLEAITELPKLKKLWFDESKEVTDYSFLSGARQVVALGVEGDLWTKQKVDTLKPFSNLTSLEALFLSSVQLKDKNLDYIAKNPRLKYLWCSRFAPKTSFDSLRRLMPDLECQWCDNFEG